MTTPPAPPHADTKAAERTAAPTTPPALDTLYAPPSEAIQKALLPHLIGFHEEYLRATTFFCLATGRAQGLDASPRGGAPGFVHVLDPKHIAFADWPGNYRVESLRNLDEDPRAALLFLFPGRDVFLRINGRAHRSMRPELLDRLSENGKRPKLGVVVEIDEVLFHCGKAVHRAGLWKPESRVPAGGLPSIGEMKAALMGHGPDQADALDREYERALRHGLY